MVAALSCVTAAIFAGALHLVLLSTGSTAGFLSTGAKVAKYFIMGIPSMAWMVGGTVYTKLSVQQEIPLPGTAVIVDGQVCLEHPNGSRVLIPNDVAMNFAIAHQVSTVRSGTSTPTEYANEKMIETSQLIETENAEAGCVGLMFKGELKGQGTRVENSLYTATHVWEAICEEPVLLGPSSKKLAGLSPADYKAKLVYDEVQGVDITVVEVNPRVWAYIGVKSVKMALPKVGKSVTLVAVTNVGRGLRSTGTLGRLEGSDGTKHPVVYTHSCSSMPRFSGGSLRQSGKFVAVHKGEVRNSNKNICTILGPLVPEFKDLPDRGVELGHRDESPTLDGESMLSADKQKIAEYFKNALREADEVAAVEAEGIFQQKGKSKGEMKKERFGSAYESMRPFDPSNWGDEVMKSRNLGATLDISKVAADAVPQPEREDFHRARAGAAPEPQVAQPQSSPVAPLPIAAKAPSEESIKGTEMLGSLTEHLRIEMALQLEMEKVKMEKEEMEKRLSTMSERLDHFAKRDELQKQRSSKRQERKRLNKAAKSLGDSKNSTGQKQADAKKEKA